MSWFASHGRVPVCPLLALAVVGPVLHAVLHAAPPTAPLGGAIRHVHDPAVVRSGDTYYLFFTGPGILMRRSRDLRHWESIGQVFDTVPEWTREIVPGHKGHLWAPDVKLVGNRFLLFYSVSTFGSNRSCIGVAANTTLDPGDPRYRWQDLGMAVKSTPGETPWNAIDPHVVRDGNRWFLVFGSFWSGIKLVRIDPDTGAPRTRSPKPTALASRPHPNDVEAPFLVRRGRYWYLFVSFGTCCRGVDSTYHLAVGRAREIEGPYIDVSGRPMLEGGGTILLTSHLNCRGPGHCAVLRDGKKWHLVHHMYDADHNGVPTLQIRPLLWSRDGWPLAGAALGIDGRQASAPPDTMAGNWLHAVAFREPAPIRLLPNGRINEHEGPATWSVDGSGLVLRWPAANAPGGAWIDRCVVSEDRLWYVGMNQDGTGVRGWRVLPGTRSP